MAESGNINSGLQVLTQAEHDGDTTPTKKVSTYAYDINGTLKKRLTGTPAGTHFPLDVTILDDAGSPITSFGGGVEYTEGDTDASITGKAMMLEGAANALVPAQGTAADGMLVNLGSNNDVTVTSGAITETNSNAIKTAVELIDDTVATLGTTTYTEATTKGITIGAVRRDADTTLVNTTNEVGPLQMDANGRLKVEVFDSGDSHTVDNNGTFVVQENGAALTALQLIDDTVSTDDTSTHTPATTKAINVAFVADETSTDSVNEGDIGMARMTLDRRIIISSENKDDAAWTASGKVATAGYVFDDASIDVLDEGDVGYARVDSQRRQYVNVGGGIPVFGQNTSTSTSQVQISSTSVVIQTIRITALSSNTEPIYIGLTGLSTTASSTELLPGDSMEMHGSFNLNTLYFIKATAVSGGVSFVYQP